MSLNVIGLVSGGKDSFFSLLHCIAHGHRVVALANLHPEEQNDDDVDEDLNSFMYQTVGHQVIPLYSQATGLPVYRQPIIGHAVHSGRDYSQAAHTGKKDGKTDETESMMTLLRTVMAAHPEANAVCAGALLSTYQRTRVESVAVRLGLTSLAYMWKYPVLPGLSSDKADYLQDLLLSQFDARIIKVASGGLDESMLWANVASAAGRHRLSRALERMGLLEGGVDAHGSLLGEGGEYETLVVDGPRALFAHGSIEIKEDDRHVVHEGGGTAWLRIANATVVPKESEESEESKEVTVPQPGLFDARFSDVLKSLESIDPESDALSLETLPLDTLNPSSTQPIATWCITPQTSTSITEATQSIVDQARLKLAEIESTSPTDSIVRTLVVLRRMADFAAFNAVYGSLFAGVPPNPPARVTIASDLPVGVDVAVYFGVITAKKETRRDGLHVQSRSYWAPANIGPYSQAVSVLAAGYGGPRIVSVAGQIPLVPATMELPAENLAYSTTLALQHLWRIGVDVGVQWWTSAVAYIPRGSASEESLQQKTTTIAQAWRRAHEWRPKSDEDNEDEDEDDDDEDGPDLWDRKFDSRYAMYGGSGDKDAGPQLPDWAVFASSAEKEKTLHGGPVFLAEVGELPRGAPVEWHAHAGLGQIKKQGTRGSCVQTRAWTSNRRKIYETTLKYVSGSDDDDSEDEDVPAKEETRVVQTVEAWPHGLTQLPSVSGADVVYVDTQAISVSAAAIAEAPIVPCFSLWAGNGERLSAVIVRTSYA